MACCFSAIVSNFRPTYRAFNRDRENMKTSIHVLMVVQYNGQSMDSIQERSLFHCRLNKIAYSTGDSSCLCSFPLTTYILPANTCFMSAATTTTIRCDVLMPLNRDRGEGKGDPQGDASAGNVACNRTQTTASSSSYVCTKTKCGAQN